VHQSILFCQITKDLHMPKLTSYNSTLLKTTRRDERMPSTSDFVFIGVKGTVLALNRYTGEEVWNVSLKGSEFVNLVLDGENLYATVKGEIFCLNPITGDIRWNNPLRGMGYGLVSIASETINQALPAEKRQRDQAAAAGGAAAAGL
jgi:outer membrane protein assembly factor BamB